MSIGVIVRRNSLRLSVALTLVGLFGVEPSAAQGRPGRPPAPANAKKPAAKPAAKPKKRAAPAAPHANQTSPSPNARHPGDRQLIAPAAHSVDLRIERMTLDNGLRVVLSPQRGLPAVAIAMAYAAGSARESVGQQGQARDVATMMSSGPNQRLGAGEYQRLVRAYGGSTSAIVSRDLAEYSVLLPPGALELGLWLEASRMAGPSHPDQATNSPPTIVPQRAPVLLEVRARVEALTFEGYWPYAHDDVATPANDSALASTARDFHRAWYGPSNAVLAIAGDFDTDEAIVFARKWFGAVPRREPPEAAPTPALVDQTNERTGRADVESGDPQAFVEGWAVPAASDPSCAALAIAAVILRDRSRLAERVHAERLQRLAGDTTLDVRFEPRRLHSFWTVELSAGPRTDLDSERTLVDTAIDELGRLGPSADEMRRAWAERELEQLEGIGPLDRRAAALARAEAIQNDARVLLDESAAATQVTRDDVRKAVGLYLGPTRRSVFEVRAPRPEPVAPAAAAPAHERGHRPPATGRKHAPGKPAKKKTTTPPHKKKSAKPRSGRP